MTPAQIAVQVQQGLSIMMGIDRSCLPAATTKMIREACATLSEDKLKASALRKFVEGDLTDGHKPYRGLVGLHTPQCRSVVMACDFLSTLLAQVYARNAGTKEKSTAKDKAPSTPKRTQQSIGVPTDVDVP